MRRINKRNIRNVSLVNSMNRINKRGQWQNYLLPAIMAVLVLGISFYFIFNEYFTGEGLDREICKESIMVRGAVPDVKTESFNLLSLKNDFPLKCKTKVIEVTVEDVTVDKDGKREIDNIIGDALVECWYIFGNGDANIFASSFYGSKTICLPCARIHLTNDAKEAVKADSELNGKIDIEALLNGAKFDDKFFYLDYLNGVGQLFEPFNPAFSIPFNLNGDKFIVDDSKHGSKIGRIKDGSKIKMYAAFSNVSLPKYLDVTEGDLIIVLGELADSGSEAAANYVPYMFYFQNGQPGYPTEMKKHFFSGLGVIDDYICNSWEGIPA